MVGAGLRRPSYQFSIHLGVPSMIKRPLDLAVTSTAVLCLAATMASAQDLYAPRTDWTSLTGGDLNISGFVFRDANRNGVYDEDDPTMEGIATQMTSPQGNSLIRWTNSNGFANFSMSARNSAADVSSPGLYDFEVIVPGGWELTTGNARQTKRFDLAPGAVADMVADPPFFPVGIAPTLSISGPVPEAARDEVVSVRSPSGEWLRIGAEGTMQFRLPAQPGEWQIAFGDGEDRLVRSVEVEEFPVQLSTAGGASGDPTGTEVVVDYEDVTEKPIREMPSGVGGLNWWNMVALQVAPSYNNSAVSGRYVGYNSSGHPARIWLDKPFSFVGGHFGVAWQRAHGETLHLRGYRRGELVYEDQITLSYLGPVWFQADYDNIDRLDLATEHYWQFVSDDLKFAVPSRLAAE
jgi:hypothetical protein